jgi:hypothetical protein
VSVEESDVKKVLTTRVGSDGVLTVLLGREGANKVVRVEIEAEEDAGLPATREEWLRFLEETGGQITDPSFGRPPQGELQDRDPLS